MSWTAIEDCRLATVWPGPGCWSDALLEHLPGKSRLAIQRRASQLGLTRAMVYPPVAWSRHEDNLVRRYYPEEGTDMIDRLHNRTRRALKAKAARLGVRYTGPHRGGG